MSSKFYSERRRSPAPAPYSRESRDRDSRNSRKFEEKRAPDNKKMEAPLSSYWVKFFKSAGFPTDVATRHAVIFSNNRIKPDMLPELDKPSLKEMGITLMGDMIAILRYAKKVVEETTCQKFLGSSEDSPPSVKNPPAKPAAKKVVKPVTKISTVSKAKPEAPIKVTRVSVKPPLTKKKITPITHSTRPTVQSSRPVVQSSRQTAQSSRPIVQASRPTSQPSRLYSDYIDTSQRPKPGSFKRKYDADEGDINGKWMHNESNKRLKNNDGIQFNVLLPENAAAARTTRLLKMDLEQNKNVFHRLGDSMVSSTTSIPESFNSHYNVPTFNVVGLGKDYFKRDSSVFRRLGSKDDDEPMFSRNLRNGGSPTSPQGILKTRAPLLGMKVMTKSALKKPIGTMRADEEAIRQRSITDNVRHLMRTASSFNIYNNPFERSFERKMPITGKLASERMDMPAKSRLGGSKQVTFNNLTTVNHIRKPGVFSRLGV